MRVKKHSSSSEAPLFVMSEKPEFSEMNQSEIQVEGDEYLDHDQLNLLHSDSHPLNLDHFPDIGLLVDDADSVSPDAGVVLLDHFPDDPVFYVNPDPHISTNFFTFSAQTHALMMNSILAARFATADEIKTATPPSVLFSWRTVWKDRNEDTAYYTAWKRMQEKLSVHVENGNKFLCFKNNLNQFISHIDQWQEIVMTHHGEADLRHLGVKETIERIKHMWTVGAKLYGIPESFIRVCVAECPMCCDSSSGSAPRKRGRYEYTETFQLPAKEVSTRLHELAVKHKAVLCIRQKYIKRKPFLAEVKDYACHRAGQASSKKSKISKRDPYTTNTKRCGCEFRIRAIVPILDYKDEDKTFVYNDEGVAIFKLYAVHTGHVPGPSDGNARIMHRFFGNKGGSLMDQDAVYEMREDEDESSGQMGNDSGNSQHSVFHQIKEVQTELGLLQAMAENMPLEQRGSLSQGLFETLNKLRSMREHGSSSVGLLPPMKDSDDLLVGGTELANWGGHDQSIFEDGKDTELVEDDENSFGRILGASWGQPRTDCNGVTDLLGETCKPVKWWNDNEFDEKSLLDCGNSKLIKPLTDDKTIEQDVGLTGLQVEDIYPENPKWYDSTRGMDSNADCGDSGLPRKPV